MASMLVAPQVPLLLTTIPGIIRASRLLATIAPRSALPRLVLRVMPAIYFLTTWVPVALVVHAMGNVLLLVGLALFTGQCGCSNMHTATNKQANLTKITIQLHPTQQARCFTFTPHRSSKTPPLAAQQTPL